VISLGKLQTLHDVDEATDDLRSSEDCSGAAENIDGSGPQRSFGDEITQEGKMPSLEVE
jgi:hypothetical protein